MRNLALPVLLASLMLAGCFDIAKPKSISGPVEETFKARWVAKRMTELQASGTAPDPREARSLAAEEFRKKFEYTTAAQTPDPVTGSTH